ncbi:glycosyltransferase family 4 protein [Nakamurella sp. GG22]
MPVLIIVENLSVPFDRRVWQESRALSEAGYEVTVICPQGTTRDTDSHSVIEGIHIYRYPLRAATGGPAGYLREYGSALWHSFSLAWKLSRQGRFDIIQACNPPDLLFLVALPFKLQGTMFIFDHHDLVPELFESRFGRRGLLRTLVVLLERITFALADTVISTNESYRGVAMRRGKVRPERVHVVRSAPDLARFTRVPADTSLRRGKRFLTCYLGVMGPQDGVDYALRAVAHLRHTLNRTDFHAVFIGSGDSFDDLVALSYELGIQDIVEFTGRVPDAVVHLYLSTADVCLAPDPKNPLNDVSTMNKIVEYMAMGRPVVSFDLTEARVSAGDAAVYATPNDEREFACLVGELLDDPDRRRAMGRIGRKRVEDTLSWEISRNKLLAAYQQTMQRSTQMSRMARFRGDEAC